MGNKDENMDVGALGGTLRVINRLVEEGLLLEYAVAGGVATLYYTEPVLTYDFDLVCLFPGKGPLIDPSPIFHKLKEWGYAFGKENRIMINGVPVQLIPAEPGLMEEALDKAAPVEICGVTARILRPEYLAAIMLNLYRPKDRASLDLLIGNGAVKFNQKDFMDIVKRYDLTEKWNRFNEV